jgi:uncharacterized membrane protein SpoIIM required for sporulation
MLKRSASIYAAGFVFGAFTSGVLIAVYPSLYYAFLEMLQKKIVVQSQLIKNLTLMIIANNIVAAAIASFGGTVLSKIVDVFDSEVARMKELLYSLPAGILFVNGTVLGFFAVLYNERMAMYLSGIFPHGLFEIPAIILSGSIGLDISEKAQAAGGDFQSSLNVVAKGKLSMFGIIILLIIVGGILEVGSI